MVEWGRLLSGYRGEILGRRFESCPPRHMKNALHKERVLFSVAGPRREGGIRILSSPPYEKRVPQRTRFVLNTKCTRVCIQFLLYVILRSEAKKNLIFAINLFKK